MKKYLVVSLLAASWAISPVLHAKTTDASAAAAPADSGLKAQVIDLTTKVTDINYDTRMLKVETPEGNVFDFKVDKSVQNLKQIKKGDLVNIKYQESLAWALQKHGAKQAPAKTVTEKTSVQDVNKKPEITDSAKVSIVATITAIDTKKPSVTLKGPEGKVVTVTVKNPANLTGVKTGDQVDITYTESLVLAVEKAKKK